jgi:hypothetical protein
MTMMWQWDRVVRSMARLSGRRCGLSLEFVDLYRRVACHRQHATIDTSSSTDEWDRMVRGMEQEGQGHTIDVIVAFCVLVIVKAII